jgi:hypothetical protein
MRMIRRGAHKLVHSLQKQAWSDEEVLISTSP